MLSSTAFDGLRATKTWYMLFWGDASGFFTHVGSARRRFHLFPQLRPWYLAFETLIA